MWKKSTVSATPGGSTIAATGNTAVNVFAAPLPVAYNASTPPGLNLTARGSFIATATGFATNPTGPVDWFAAGRSVTLNIRNATNLSGTSNATTMQLNGIPSFLYPITTQQLQIDASDSGTYAFGLATLSNAGLFNCYKTPNLAAFTNSGTKGINTMPMTYTLS